MNNQLPIKDRIIRLAVFAAVVLLTLMILYAALTRVTGLVVDNHGNLIRFILISIGVQVLFTIIQGLILFTLRRSSKVQPQVENIVKYSLCIASAYVPIWVSSYIAKGVYLPFRGVIILGTIIGIAEIGWTYYDGKFKPHFRRKKA